MKSAQFKLLLILQLITLFLVVMLYLKKDTPSAPLSNKTENSARAKAIKSQKYNVDYGSNYVYGNVDAKNELLVFTRYNCMHCANFYNTVLDSLKATAIKTGDLKLVFIDNVNPKDKDGMFLAQLGEIARESDKYETVQDILYKAAELDSATVIDQIVSLGISKDQIQEELNSKHLKERILQDNKIGDQIHMSGTPTLLLNGEKLIGYQHCKTILSLLKPEKN